jgi:hypothetical protein
MRQGSSHSHLPVRFSVAAKIDRFRQGLAGNPLGGASRTFRVLALLL